MARLLLVTGIFPPDSGGPASYVPRVASELARRHEILGVVTLSEVTQAADDGYPFQVIRIPRAMHRAARVATVVATIVRLARNADTVYLNGMVLEGIVACKLLRRKRVVVKVVGDLIWEKAQTWESSTMTLDEFQTARHPVKWRILRALQSWYTRQADVVITPSRYLAQIVRGWGVSPERIRVIYNAVRAAAMPQEQASPQYDLITVARLLPWKGIDVLIDLARERGWSLKIVGDGEGGDELHARAAHAPTVTFVGRVDSDRVIEEIRTARVLVLNSRYEGLPHVVLEAHAAGVPVIATDVGGTAEAIRDGETGVLVPPGDTSALENAIEELLASPARRRELALNAAAALRERFSFAALVERTDAVLGG